MEEKEFFNDLKILVWNKFPYCRFNKIKDYTLSGLKDFENIRVIEVEIICMNILIPLSYYVNVNDIKQKGKEIKIKLALQIINDIKLSKERMLDN